MVELSLLKRTTETFLSTIKGLNEAGIEGRLLDNICELFDNFILSCGFTNAGIDLFYWWLYEKVDKKIHLSPDLFSDEAELNVEKLEDLYHYMHFNDKLYFK